MAERFVVAPQLGKVLRDSLTSEEAIIGAGVGGNLIEVLAELTRAADRLAEAIETFCRMNDGE